MQRGKPTVYFFATWSYAQIAVDLSDRFGPNRHVLNNRPSLSFYATAQSPYGEFTPVKRFYNTTTTSSFVFYVAGNGHMSNKMHDFARI